MLFSSSTLLFDVICMKADSLMVDKPRNDQVKQEENDADIDQVSWRLDPMARRSGRNLEA